MNRTDAQAIRVDQQENRENARAHYNLADLLNECGRWAEVAEHWGAYLRLDQTTHWAAYARGRLASTG